MTYTQQIPCLDLRQIADSGQCFRMSPGPDGSFFNISCGRLLLIRQSGQAIILAGGLSGANVAEAIRATGVFAVDVSSGIETAPGQKHEGKMQQFIHAVQQAN